MRIAGNKLKHLREFFFDQLTNKYLSEEIQALFKEACMHYLSYTATQVITKLEEHLNQSDLLKLYDCAKELAKGQPIQYVFKTAWFMGLEFSVNNAVLIPRPETEELVELILAEHPQIDSVLDIGTGSGCIPVALKKNRPTASVIACDISAKALLVASENAMRHQTQIQFIEADVLDDLQFIDHIHSTFEIVVSNPPYIKLSEKNSMADHVLAHEPHLALFVDSEDEILFYRQIINLSQSLLKKGGTLYFELNPLTADAVAQYCATSKLFSVVKILNDLSGKKRFLQASKTL